MGLDPKPPALDTPAMTSREKTWISVLAVIGILALVELFYIPGHNPWLEALNNAGHLPVFGLLAIAILHLVKIARPQRRAQPLRAYVMAALLAAGLGVLSEAIQYFTPRDADLEDLVRDVLGAVSFLALYAAVRDQDLKTQRANRPGLKRNLLFTTALLWLAGGWTLCMWSAAYVKQWVQFPVICDFDSYLSNRFVTSNGVTLRRDEVEGVGGKVRGTRMTFGEGEWPGLEIVDVHSSWEGRDSLVLEVVVDGDQPVVLGLSAYDREHNHEYEDRFSFGLKLDPGMQRLAVSLGRIIAAPRGREMEIEHMKGVTIFSDSTSAGQSVLLERLYLK